MNGLRMVIASNEEPYVLSRGGVRVDHVDSGWGSGFYVSRIHGEPGCG
ncbi:MAG: hypothetical protein ABIJ09_10430 [Pseudomonadota bacterium]